ncbi:MAG: hypothetical protein RIR17_1041, partial [Planctomycetota bacterium]
ISGIIGKHWASYLAGAYLGCDIQTMPEAICEDTGTEVGYGTVPIMKSPITGGRVRPWKLKLGNQDFTPREIHNQFYGRAHLVFGWVKEDQNLMIPWDHLPEYMAMVIEDARELFGPGQRQFAYMLGTLVHIVSDCMIKSIRPGVDLNLVDGKYTRRNRPIQDLVTFHEIGIKELKINWPAILSDMADDPIEKVQFHHMRVGKQQGKLGQFFKQGWEPQKQELLHAVLKENRRYLKIYNQTVLKELELTRTVHGWDCSKAMKTASGGLSYAEMVDAAQKAGFRQALWQMTEEILKLFKQVIERSATLRNLPDDSTPSADELEKRWM